MRALLTVASLLVLSVAARAGEPDPDDPLPLAIDFRKIIPPLVNKEVLEDRRKKLPTATEEELAYWEQRGEELRKMVLAKFRKVQRNAGFVDGMAGNPFFRTPHASLTIASIGLEREEKLAKLRERELVAQQKHGGLGGAEDYSRWLNTPEALELAADRKRILQWAKDEVDETVRKAAAGESDAGKVLAEIRKEVIDEMDTVSQHRLDLRNERHRRKGEPLEKSQIDLEIEATAERMKEARLDRQHEAARVRVAPVRTEYEARPNEMVETLFIVWNGTKPYMLNLKCPKAGQGLVIFELAEAGEVHIPLSYAQAGTYEATLYVLDASGESAEGKVTITVAGEPVKVDPEEEEPAKSQVKTKPPKGPAGGGGDPGAVAPVPIQGTFQAMSWHLNAGHGRWDKVSSNEFRVYPVPLTLTIEPDGKMHSKVRYELPQAEMDKPKTGDMRNIFWKVSFDLEGMVNWKNGHTVITIKNGHDESGYEEDKPKFNDKGQQEGFIGHWRDWHKTDYSMSLDGWTLPGPQAARWLEPIAKNPQVAAELPKLDLETLGVPFLAVPADGKPVFRDRGFFGASGLEGAPAMDGIVPKRVTYSRAVHHMGYDGKNETETDETANRQKRADKDAKEGRGGWYIKILGAGEAAPAGPPTEPKDDDLLAFGLWPTKPITVKAGETMSARAMGVLGKNVYDAVDLSEKAAWKGSDGLTLLGGGTFKAAKPGTYTLTATHAGPGGPMTSTIRITVTE